MRQNLLLRWLINAVALYAAAEFVPGIQADGGWQVLLFMALIFGLVNALIRPILKFLTCPLIMLTLGLFTLVINALMLQLAAWLGRQFGLGFYVRNFWSALLGALVISVVSFVLTMVIGDENEDKKKKRR
ncbi:MAG: phage holin family protein [Anaerolineales bacterium]|nr:phage holin family protein [Anaerolineales bacterium]